MMSRHKGSSKGSQEIRRILAKNESPGSFVAKLYYVKMSVEPIIDEIISSAVSTVETYKEPVPNNKSALKDDQKSPDSEEKQNNSEDKDSVNVEFEAPPPKPKHKRNVSALPRKTPHPGELSNLFAQSDEASDDVSVSTTDEEGETPAEFAVRMQSEIQAEGGGGEKGGEGEGGEEEGGGEEEEGDSSRHGKLTFDTSLQEQQGPVAQQHTEEELIRRVDELTEMLVGPLGDAAKKNPVLIKELRNLLERLGYRMDSILEKSPDLNSSVPPSMPPNPMDGGAVRGCGEQACSTSVCAAGQSIAQASAARYKAQMQVSPCVVGLCPGAVAPSAAASASMQPSMGQDFAVPGAPRTRTSSQERRSRGYAQSSRVRKGKRTKVHQGNNREQREYASEEQLTCTAAATSQSVDNVPEPTPRAIAKCCALSPCFKPTCKQTTCRDPKRKS